MSTSPAARQPQIAPTEITAIVKRAYGSSARLESADPMPGGTINTTFRLQVRGEQASILRAAPPPEIAEAGPSWLTAHGLRREVAAMNRVPALQPLFPRTVHLDTSHAIVRRDWVIQTAVQGEPWADMQDDLPEDANHDLWHQLGEVANDLHAISGERFGPIGVPGALTFSRWSDLLMDDADGLIRDAERFGLPVELMSTLRITIERHRAMLDTGTQPRLIHSDLNPRHVFIQPTTGGDYRISGLIDMEFARFADPLSESIFTLFSLDPGSDAGAYKAYLAGYGDLPPGPEPELSIKIYALIALGWIATDLAHQGKEDAVQRILKRFRQYLSTLEA